MTAVAEALELTRVESHLNPPASYDLADHPVPTGREEIWRFTPLKRLRGPHDAAPPDGGGISAAAAAPDGVTVQAVGADSPVRGASGLGPTDRLGGRLGGGAEGACAGT